MQRSHKISETYSLFALEYACTLSPITEQSILWFAGLFRQLATLVHL